MLSLFYNFNYCNNRFKNAVSHVIPLLEVLSKDPEAVVRQHLVEQLKALTKVSRLLEIY